MKRPFFTVGFSFFAGCLIYLCLLNKTVLYAALPLFIAAAVGGTLCKRKKGGVLLEVLTAALFSFSAGITAAFLSFNIFYVPNEQFVGKELSFQAKVIGNAEYKESYTLLPVRADLRKTDGDRSGSASATVILRLKQAVTAQPSDIVECTATIDSVETDSDGRAYLSPIYLSASCDSINIVGRGRADIVSLSSGCKTAVTNSIYSVFSDDVAGLLTGISLSYTSNTPYYITKALKTCSLSHLTSVSGLHITLLSGIVTLALSKLKNKRLSGLISLLFIWSFVFISGLRLPAIRAALMMTVLLSGRFFLRRADSLNSLGLSCLLICLLIPFSAKDVGFICSVLATLGIVTLSKPLSNFLARPLLGKRLLCRLIPLTNLVSLTLCSMVFSLPVLLLVFGSFSLISVIANILVTPFAVLCVAGCLLGGTLSLIPIFGFIGYPFLLCGGLVAKYIIFITGLLSKIPFASVYTKYGFIAVWLLLFYLILLYGYVKKKSDSKLKKSTLALISAITALSLCFCCAFVSVTEAGRYTVYSCGEGEETALLFVHGDQAIIIGCDRRPSVNYNMLSVMRKNGIDSPSLFVPLKSSSPLGSYYIAHNSSPEKTLVSKDKEYLDLLLEPTGLSVISLPRLLAEKREVFRRPNSVSFGFNADLSGVTLDINGLKIYVGEQGSIPADNEYDYIISGGTLRLANGERYSAENVKIEKIFSKTTVRRFD